MNNRISFAKQILALVCILALAFAGILFSGDVSATAAQGAPPAGQAPAGAPGGRAPQPPAPPTAGAHLEIADGSTVSYRVQEQLAGVNFPTDAVGTASGVSGTLVIMPDGSVNSTQSKLTVDLRTLKSDQDLRDNYLRTRTFETEKFPSAEFVPKRITGIPMLIPTGGQAGFQLIGDMTIHGVTSEVTWNGVVTFSKDQMAGRAMTDLNFAQFGLAKPTLARLLSVNDKIQLELSFRMKRS